MHKAILMMLLAIMSSSAMAEWVNVGMSDDGTLTFYTDPSTIRKSGNKVKMWSLLDYKTTQKIDDGKTFMSTRQQNEYDCKEERTRSLYIIAHSGNMARGTVVGRSDDSDKWRPVSPGSGGEDLWKFACGKQ